MIATQLNLGSAPHDMRAASWSRYFYYGLNALYIDYILNNYNCLQDIWGMRIAKLGSSVDAFLKMNSSLVDYLVDYLTLM